MDMTQKQCNKLHTINPTVTSKDAKQRNTASKAKNTKKKTTKILLINPK